ncbi:solute carrier family 35 member SLC35F1/F2/F6 [Blastocladiella britannica]|nr:solute carrier family 35 member SLC35F1/F2/F6 [Blastocladiella britannica]
MAGTKINLRRVAGVFGYGQILSVLVGSSQLFNTGLNLATNASDPPFYINFPQLASHYTLLFTVFAIGHVVMHLWDKQRVSSGVREKDAEPSWPFDLKVWFQRAPYYLAFGIFDWYGNWTVTKAFGYTSPLSAFLLNSVSTPFTVLFSMLFFKARYRPLHYLAILVTIGGLAIITWQDLVQPSPRLSLSPSDPDKVWLGNVLGLLSGLFFALANVTQEWAVKRLGSIPELCMSQGLFGALVAVVHVLIFDRDEVTALLSLSASQYAPFFWNYAGYLAVMLALYSAGPWYFGYASATLFNMSLLTSGFMVLIGSVVVLKTSEITAMYFVGFLVMVVGLAAFNFDPKGWRDVFMVPEGISGGIEAAAPLAPAASEAATLNGDVQSVTTAVPKTDGDDDKDDPEEVKDGLVQAAA